MKTFTQQSRRRGFTLIELLTVIAIIGVLAAILIPAVGAVKKVADRAAAMSNCKQIALAYNTFAQSGSRARNITSSGEGAYVASEVGTFAGILAKRGGLNDASIWYITSDPALAAEINNLATLRQVLDDPAVDQASDHNLSVSPISWAVAVNLPVNAESSTTPIAWTRGANTDGTWDADSPWEGDGGHIAYLDGHAAWYEDLNDDPLVNHSAGSGTTTDITQAIYSTGEVLEDE